MKNSLLVLSLILPCTGIAQPNGLPPAAASPVPSLGDGLNRTTITRPTAAMRLSEIELDVLAEHYKKLFGQLQDLEDSNVMNPEDVGSHKNRLEKLAIRLSQLKVDIEQRDEKILRAKKEQAESRPVKTG